ncbi:MULTISPECIES: hypothetical protein [Weeksellaceae]|jgi:hypothetical protein|uniref:Uncharacterized protein n=1 Tax=Elizabethkingia anophelis TaxID=1117645 RepID=A0A7Z7M0M7_9FLAO|nr:MULTISPECIES: hypothetical protein [Weeksellaceae]MDV3704702.1 hypothetical protein [Elizabethkingia anophelis]MDV3712625.1 hypothetical protein [Elizabethkingia anophelis]MDV3767342.1 hypothetical protein [Elizabethkingia anophelis]STD12026.1 Uncharacterised protein [Elizabethkingia anophelis]
MKNNNLPTDQLKKYGIIDQDNTFSKKLSPEDIQRFLQGYTIVADNDKRRATFQLVENNSRLNVIFLERDKNLSELLENSEKRIEYTDIKEVSNKLSPGFLGLEKKAFVFDEETGKVFEFDLIGHATELTAIIADKKDAQELGRYKNELLKLKEFIQDKLELGFPPEIAKEISRDLNIVSREIDIVDGIFQKQEKSDVQLNVNDPDLYQDGNRMREEEEQERDEKRGFRR